MSKCSLFGLNQQLIKRSKIIAYWYESFDKISPNSKGSLEGISVAFKTRTACQIF